MSYRDRLLAFYQKHNPAKLGEVDSLLQTFAGREEAMFTALRNKYEAGVAVTDDGDSNINCNVKGVHTTEPEIDAVQAEMWNLLCDMNSVDLNQLLDQLKGQTTVRSDLLSHLLTFMQHFTTCAHRFQELGQTMMTITAAKATAMTAPIENTAREDASTQTGNSFRAKHDVAVDAVRVKITSVGTQTEVKVTSVEAQAEANVMSVGTQAEANVEKVNEVPCHGIGQTCVSDLLPVQRPLVMNIDSVEINNEEEEEEVQTSMMMPTGLKANGKLNPHRSIGVVHRLKPDKHKKVAVIGALLTETQLSYRDSITLEPGVYHENLRFVNSGEVELVAAFPGAAVIIKPLSDLEPVIRAEGTGTRLRLSGVVIVENDTTGNLHMDLSAPSNPLVAVSDGAHVDFHGCHFYQGSCGVEAMGACTEIRLHLSLILSCTFAGVFLRHGAKAVITQCKIKRCEAGVRVASKSSMHASETVLEENTTDGVVGYEGAEGTLERCRVLRCGGNGVFLAPGSTFTVGDTTIELNGLYGIQRLQGSGLHLRDSVVRDNALLPINDTHST